MADGSAVNDPRVSSESSATFRDLNVIKELCDACSRLGWKSPTEIQRVAIPVALQGQDVIGLAETGSGKTGAFGLPLLQALIAAPQKFFALILTPTRELAYQIKEQLEALGKIVGLTVCVLVGGMDMKRQIQDIKKEPHIIVGTPGRIVDHLKTTKGFSLQSIKYLVLDEADRILDMDFADEVNTILHCVPSERQTMLFSATVTTKVNKLQRAALRNPATIEVSSKYQTVSKLKQYMLFVPFKYKLTYLVYVLHDLGNQSVMIFCATQENTLRAALTLRNLGFSAIPLYGRMDQKSRLGALTKFKAQQKSILLATDVASRGLDIPDVDLVINYDVPHNSKDYIHRVGRTARAGKEGQAITLVTQYDILVYVRIELVLKDKLPVYPAAEEEVMVFQHTVAQAELEAKYETDRINESLGPRQKRQKGGPVKCKGKKKKKV